MNALKNFSFNQQNQATTNGCNFPVYYTGDPVPAPFQNMQIPKRNCSCGKQDGQIDGCEQCQPKKLGMTGWVCPVCGMGNSPFSAVCPCKSGKISF